MDSELSNLIVRLQNGINNNASYIRTIRHPKLLVAALTELNQIIGNDKIKDSVATQITHLIMVKRRSYENKELKEDEVMLNTVLFSSPGTGKTLIGTKLAKIWFALGYLDNTYERPPVREAMKEILQTNNDDVLMFTILIIVLFVFIALASWALSFYTKFGGYWTLAIILFMVVVIAIYLLYIYNNNVQTYGVKYETKNNIPRDDQLIKIVSRADFIGQYVGFTAKKTNELLNDNLGKVLFVDEAYSLVTDMHDSFGIEAVTAINLFLSQRPKEIIVIFAGYRDLLENSVFAVQPGLKRRFMWQFDCGNYDINDLFQIFKSQLKTKGWGLLDEESTHKLFLEYKDSFPSYGGDTERLSFFAKLEHSRDFIKDETGMSINLLSPVHVLKGIKKLNDNNIQGEYVTTNPLANMLSMFKPRNKKIPGSPKKDDDLIEAVRYAAGQKIFR